MELVVKHTLDCHFSRVKSQSSDAFLPKWPLNSKKTRAEKGLEKTRIYSVRLLSVLLSVIPLLEAGIYNITHKETEYLI